MGEVLAKAELFIFFVTLVQRFRFGSVRGKEPDPEKYTLGLTRVPKQFDVSVTERLKK